MMQCAPEAAGQKDRFNAGSVRAGPSDSVETDVLS